MLAVLFSLVLQLRGIRQMVNCVVIVATAIATIAISALIGVLVVDATATGCCSVIRCQFCDVLQRVLTVSAVGASQNVEFGAAVGLFVTN